MKIELLMGGAINVDVDENEANLEKLVESQSAEEPVDIKESADTMFSITVELIVVFTVIFIGLMWAVFYVRPKKEKAKQNNKNDDVINDEPIFYFNDSHGETSILNINSSISNDGAKGKILRKKTGDTLDIVKEYTTIGKDLLYSDYCIRDNNAISRLHVTIVASESGVKIEDLDSTNGTYLNGIKLTPRIKYRLSDGDVIKLGDEDFIFQQKV